MVATVIHIGIIASKALMAVTGWFLIKPAHVCCLMNFVR